MSIRPYIDNKMLKIDGRMIPYPLTTAADYLEAKHGMSDKEIEDFIDNHYEQYSMLNAIIAMKQSCFLLRHTEYSCGSLSNSLYTHKNEMIVKYNETYDKPFDEDFYENYRKNLSKVVEHLKDVDLSDLKRPIAVIYDKPLDFPDKFVIRIFDMENPTNIVALTDSMRECHMECIDAGFRTRIARSKDDDWPIVESWI
ncbi:MAG: hypothetical protein HDR24_13710 [Lachnospiraceae bacterium]|nr:hypothetical protein [Lachnospiraceae bacterium]